MIQFYSSGEEVLQQASEGVPNSLEPVWGLIPFVNVPIGTNAWNIQEKAKGTPMLAAIMAGDSTAGWGFRLNPRDPSCGENTVGCTTQSMDRAEAKDISVDELRINPFFKAFINPAIISPGAGSENAHISHPHVLSYEVSALSYAAGGTNISDDEKLNSNSKINMNTYNNGWPQERGGESEKEWWHSDFKDVAYRYTFPLFDQIVTEGFLQ